jgi:ribosome-associated translation inhibitor RaiA
VYLAGEFKIKFMKFRIESAGHKLSPSLKEFATLKLSNLDRYYKDIQEIEVTLTNETKGAKEDFVSAKRNCRSPGKRKRLTGKFPLKKH